MRRSRIAAALAPLLAVGCAGAPDKGTLAELHAVQPDVAEV
jgi:hypothetical protein